MSILETIRSSLRSLLGGGGESNSAPSEPSQTEGQVSVEHEPQEDRETADASTESAIKGTDTATADESEADAEEGSEADAVAEAEAEGSEADAVAEAEAEGSEADAVAAETDAAASTGTLVDEEAGKEPAEVVSSTGTDDEEAVDAGESGTDDTAGTTETADDEETVETADESDESGEPEADEADGADGEPEADEADGAGGEPVETLKGIGPAYGERLGNAGIETVADLAAADAGDLAAEIDVSEKRITGWIDRAQEES
ncbi:helix-hairpin-helix domain-containing protein [Halobellus ordinarius]|uniref:helix-hairpin-helix domain-containing protein n=1 Tax=Halobellus ordinarius TaxID=3075120 RepID=UPI0028806982|nr:helix-hairpin-helix domain-containing protein [Halobellus sp. ZY16]